MAELGRGVVFFLCAAFILLAPGYKQLTGSAPSWAIRWDMFARRGQDLYEARFETVDASGRRVIVDRFETLGFPDPQRAPRNVRTFTQEHEAWSVAQSLCRTLGHDRPLYMFLRDATASGWKTVEDGTRDVCSRRDPSPAPTPRGANHDEEDAP